MHDVQDGLFRLVSTAPYFLVRNTLSFSDKAPRKTHSAQAFLILVSAHHRGA